MDYSRFFIESYIDKIPELFDKYIESKDICENLAYVFCGIVLIPFIKEKHSQNEVDVIKTIMDITEEIRAMNAKELTGIIYLGILENIIPEREIYISIERYMPEKLFNMSKEFEKKLGW